MNNISEVGKLKKIAETKFEPMAVWLLRVYPFHWLPCCPYLILILACETDSYPHPGIDGALSLSKADGDTVARSRETVAVTSFIQGNVEL